MLFQALVADDSWSKPVFVRTSPTPSGNGKSWDSLFFPAPVVRNKNPLAGEGVLVSA